LKKLTSYILAPPLFLIGAGQVSAAILNPYVVDEKARVLFGDSVPVLEYYGLENYKSEYIDDYLRITFTYTHSRCCFAGFLPRLYITNTDPRATSTPRVRASNAIYTLLSIPIPPGHETDWYFYDIQFDATGYHTIVKQTGEALITDNYTEVPELTQSDWVSLANHYPIFDIANPTAYSMAFTPLRITAESSSGPEIIDPVIIVPGIMGSAYKNNQLVIDPILHTYDDLIATLVANGYREGKDLFTFPYEWRDSNAFSADLLDDKISQIKTICGCEKVDIVAHSMGGLVARSYIQSTDYDQDVDQLIFLGTPHNGAPTSYLQWEAGKFAPDFGASFREAFFIAESLKNGYSTIFNYLRNRPVLSVQELLPIFNYLEDATTGLMRQYPTNYPQNVFLENLNNNIATLLSSGVNIINIVGNSGENKTIDRIRVIPTDHAIFWHHGEPQGFGSVIGDNGLERGQGDNTVSVVGSSLDGFNNEEILASHNRIPTVAENRIIKILTGKDSTSNIDSGSNTDVNILLLQLLSPIDIVVIAPDGKKIGKNFANSSEYDEIPLAFYSGFETDNEYITILNPLEGEYKVEVQGTGAGGEYGMLTSYVSDEFATTTKVTGVTAPNQITDLIVDVDNNNPQDLEVKRVVTLDILISDINGAYDLGWITDNKVRDDLMKQVKLSIKFEQKRSGEFEAKVDKILIKLLEKEVDLLFKKGKLNRQAYDLIKEDLEYLITYN
jgi:pimeloyl-ACP methyl ester carboxylesterase